VFEPLAERSYLFAATDRGDGGMNDGFCQGHARRGRPGAKPDAAIATARIEQTRRKTVTTKKYETVLIEKQDGITWLIMNRPDKRNAMSPQLHLEMDDALDELAIDPETEVVVLTGAGEAFCAGQDI
jgi:hypothetical protein